MIERGWRVELLRVARLVSYMLRKDRRIDGWSWAVAAAMVKRMSASVPWLSNFELSVTLVDLAVV